MPGIGVKGGIGLETGVVILSFLGLVFVPRSSFFSPLFYVIIQGLLTYFAHCPSHYLVGSLLGVRFNRLILAKSAMRNEKSPALRFIGNHAFTFSLILDRRSLNKVPARARRVTLLAGVTASISLPFLVAILAFLDGSAGSEIATLAFALFYLAFNTVYSPRTGDVYRARMLSRGAG
jgi:hypothetical protein